MDILLFCSTLNQGGAERQLALLGAGLAQKGFIVELYTLTPQFNQEYIAILNKSDIKHASLIKKKSIFAILKAVYFLYSQVKQNKELVVCSFLESSNLAWLLVKLFNRKFNLLIGIRDSGQDTRNLTFSRRIVLFLHRKMAFLADHIVCNSFAGKAYLIENGYTTGKIRVINNGFDYVNNQILNDKNVFYIDQLNPPFIIGSVGRITYEKGFENLIYAAKKLKDLDVNINLYIIGKVSNLDYFDSLLRLLRRLRLENIVKLLPETDNLVGFYNSIDLFISSSYKEGFSNVIAEAMLCGCPVIATNAGDSGRIVNNDDYIIKPGDIDSLTQKIIKVINLSVEDRITLGLEARKSIIERFSINNMIDAYIYLIKTKRDK